MEVTSSKAMRFGWPTAPSAAVAVRLATMPSRGDGVVVASVADDRAPAIREEGDRISATHAEVRRLDAESATADEVLAGLSTARIAHLACHGRFLPGSPRSSGLRFSDRWITTRDIHELEATPSVVVLSGSGAQCAAHGTALLDAARPRLIALAITDGDIDAAFDALAPGLEGASLIVLEPGLAVEV